MSTTNQYNIYKINPNTGRKIIHAVFLLLSPYIAPNMIVIKNSIVAII